MFLKIFAKLTGKHLTLLIKLQTETSSIAKKETVVQVFSFEFCKYLRTNVIVEQIWWLRFSGCVAKFLNIFFKL